MKAFFRDITESDTSDIAIEAGQKDNLFIKYFVLLFIVFCLLVSAGCNDSGSSDEKSESSSSTVTASTVSTSTVSTSTAWASLCSDQFPLYQGEIPGSISYELEETTTGSASTLRYYNVSVPTLSVFLPPEDIATGAAVIVCPGGGYGFVGYGWGATVAEELAENGIAAFVLKYRLPNDLIMADKSIGPLQDAQQAIKTVRQRAAEWHVDPSRVGIMGHSAGGHMAALTGVHYDDVYIDNDDIDIRPAFMVLVSAVISMDEEITHAGSRSNLLGDDPDADSVGYFSTELQVTEDTPPAWIAHAEDDTTVMVENSELFFEALDENGVTAELNLYATGAHSFFYNDATGTGWFESFLYWLETQGVTL